MTSPVSRSRQDQAATSWSSRGTLPSGGGEAVPPGWPELAGAALLGGRAGPTDNSGGEGSAASAPSGSSPFGLSLAGLVTAPVRQSRRRLMRRPAGSALLAEDRGLPVPSADGPVMGSM